MKFFAATPRLPIWLACNATIARIVSSVSRSLEDLDPADPTPELTTRIVAGDGDGDGVADFEIELVNAAPIFEANFIL